MYNLVAIAGTFDRLHKGHRVFISQAFKFGEKVIIGLTSDAYVEEKFKIQNPQPKASPPRAEKFQIRERELTNYLEKEGLSNRAEIVKIDDVYGPAIDPDSIGVRIEALLVTKETMFGARLVNKRRREKGLAPLGIIKVPLVLADDKKRIASTRIRLGEIDRWGRAYKWKMENACLPARQGKWKISEELRQALKIPQGILLKGDPQNHKKLFCDLKRLIDDLKPLMIITVGDEATKLCNQMGIPVNLAVVDYKVNRKKIYSSFFDLAFPKDSFRMLLKGAIIRVKNPPGTISRSLVTAVRKSIKNLLEKGGQRIIKVIGEEDLAGVPAILLAPLDSVVIYGQPQEGLVIIEITEKKKQALFDLIKQYL